jgi:hypothetical protein
MVACALPGDVLVLLLAVEPADDPEVAHPVARRSVTKERAGRMRFLTVQGGARQEATSWRGSTAG